MAINNGPNHLHGGLIGYDKRLFDADIIEDNNQPALKLTYLSPDGEENYPGNLKVTCIYSLTNKNELVIEYFLDSNCFW